MQAQAARMVLGSNSGILQEAHHRSRHSQDLFTRSPKTGKKPQKNILTFLTTDHLVMKKAIIINITRSSSRFDQTLEIYDG